MMTRISTHYNIDFILILLFLLIAYCPAANAIVMSDEFYMELTLPDGHPNGPTQTFEGGLAEEDEENGLFTIQLEITNLITPVDWFPAFSVNAHVLEEQGSDEISDLISVRNLPTIQGDMQTNNILALLRSDGDPGGGLTKEAGSIEIGPEFDDGTLHDITTLLGLTNSHIVIKFLSDGDNGTNVPEPATLNLFGFGLLLFCMLALLPSAHKERT